MRRLIIASCLFSTLLAVANFLPTRYFVQRDQLVSKVQERNHVCAFKLAKLTNTLPVRSRNSLTGQ